MPSTTFPIPAAELALVQASLSKCPGLTLVGAVSFSSGGHDYYDLFLTYHQDTDLSQLGRYVSNALANQQADE